jgi:ferredoxin
MRVVFIKADGSRVEAKAEAGELLLKVAQEHDLPLEGTCEAQMACSTCHVIVSPDWFKQLPPASEDEEDMLDFAFGVAKTSRLSCQIRLDATLDGLEVRIPPEARNMLGR